MGREGSEDSLAEKQRLDQQRLAEHNERQARLGRAAVEAPEDPQERQARLGRASSTSTTQEETQEEKPKSRSRSRKPKSS